MRVRSLLVLHLARVLGLSSFPSLDLPACFANARTHASVNVWRQARVVLSLSLSITWFGIRPFVWPSFYTFLRWLTFRLPSSFSRVACFDWTIVNGIYILLRHMPSCYSIVKYLHRSTQNRIESNLHGREMASIHLTTPRVGFNVKFNGMVSVRSTST